MALEFQNIPVPIQGGVDAKTDPKLLPPTKMTVLKDAIWDKVGTVRTRDGHEVLPATISSGGSISTAHGLMAYKNELLELSSKVLYSYDDSANKWVSKGAVETFPFTVEPVINNFHGKTAHDSTYLSGYEVYTWFDQRGDIRCSVIEPTTGNKVINDLQVSATGYNPRVAKTAGKVFIMYMDGTTLKGRRFDPASPYTLEAEFTVAVAGTIDASLNYGVRDYQNPGAFVIVYKTSTTANFGVLYLKEDKTVGNGVNGYPTEITHVASGATTYRLRNVGVDMNSGDIVMAIGGFGGGSDNVFLNAYTNALAVSFAQMTVYSTTVQSNRNLGMLISGSTIHLFWNANMLSYSGGVLTESNVVMYATVSTSGVLATLDEKFAHHCYLAAEPFESDKIYVGLVYRGRGSVQSLQKTLFIVDVEKNYISKIMPSTAYYKGHTATPSTWIFELNDSTTRVTETSADNFLFPMLTSDTPDSNASSRGPIAKTGISAIHISLGSESKVHRYEGPENLYFNSAFLGHYDGSVPVEHGFELYPDSEQTINNTKITRTVTLQGAGGARETTQFAFQPGWCIQPGDTISITDTVPTTYTFKFAVDGYGEDDNTSTVRIVSIHSYDRADEVAEIFKTAVNDAAGLFAATRSAATVTVTNDNNGAVTDASVTGITFGSIPNGTYSIRSVWKWVDQAGNIYRSAPSPGVTVTVSGAASDAYIGYAVPALLFTKKGNGTGKLFLEIYRTTNGGTTYYKTSEIAGNTGDIEPPINERTAAWCGMALDEADAEITSQEILYTTGGIIENIAPPSPKTFAIGKRRAVVVPRETPYMLWFSKEFVNGLGIEFSDILTLSVDEFGGELEAVGVLDDKYLLFKEAQTLFTSGDGPDPRGTGSFAKPEILAPEVGCPYQESVTTIPGGVLFKSLKGWYLIDRALQASYVGSPIYDLQTLTVARTVILTDLQVVLIFHTDGSCAYYDYFLNAWGHWTNHTAKDAVIRANQLYSVKSDGVVRKRTPGTYVDNATAIAMNVASSWIKLTTLVGYQRCQRIFLQGQFKSGKTYLVRVYYDYDETVYEDYQQYLTAKNKENRLVFHSVPTSGTFKLYFNGETTGTLNWNDSAGTIQTAFRALTNVGATTTITGSIASQSLVITFLGVDGGLDLPNVEVVNNALLAGTSLVHVSSRESIPGRTAADATQLEIHLERQKCKAIKVELFDQGGANTATHLTGFEFKVGLKRGHFKERSPVLSRTTA